jgi:thymidylate synthase (FAD)
MRVELLHHTPLFVCAKAIRKCWASEDKSDTLKSKDAPSMEEAGKRLKYDYIGEKDRELVDRVGNKNKHSSVLRHLNYTFEIQGISTKTLLAFTRHKVGIEFSVQSTRYTTKKRREYLQFTETSNTSINKMLQDIMDIVDLAIEKGFSNDDISMLLPQAYQYSCVVTMNAQAIQHFLELRINQKHAHWDIVKLAEEIAIKIPKEHKYIYLDTIEKCGNTEFKEIFLNSML